ncbi:MFS transporter [Herbidospora daliensis]|uniref:MFS transporter n=1 Tax=Herbidospora daliensis TaxID=295585 RepID=UPI0012F89F5D|nr:MFS transporter [Herbidospora daliensis]
MASAAGAGGVPAARSFRLARAAAFAVACLGLAMGAHVFGGGEVSAHAAAAGLLAALVAALPATGRERGPAVIFALMTGGQTGLHLLFANAHVILPVETGGHVHSASALVPGLGMLVTHGVAALLLALWLARGEAALWSILRLLAARLLALLIVTGLSLPVPPRPRFARRVRRARSALIRHSVYGRAPPATA